MGDNSLTVGKAIPLLQGFQSLPPQGRFTKPLVRVSELYFEAHVTIEPLADGRHDKAAALAKLYNFKLENTSLVGHGQEYYALENRMAKLIQHLRKEGLQVWCYKIEDTIIDSRSKDVLNLLRE